jgi:hypothetical protein
MKLGYARVSTAEQHLTIQLDLLRQANCERLFQEKHSGAVRDRVALGRLLEQLREGDTVVVWRLDRLARSTRDLGFQIVSEKFYTVDDFNPHITKCNKMIIMATITKLRQCQSLDWQSITSWPTRLQGGWPGGTHGVIGDNPRLRPHGRGIWCVALWRPGIPPL